LLWKNLLHGNKAAGPRRMPAKRLSYPQPTALKKFTSVDRNVFPLLSSNKFSKHRG
jgi:hypothetical protein